MRRVLWTAVLLAVGAVASGANCVETAQEIVEEAATEVAGDIETVTPEAGRPFRPEDHVDDVREVEGQRPILGFFAMPESGGTAWYVREDRLLTAEHVVVDNSPILLEGFGGHDLFRVNVVSMDADRDIALLKPEDGARTETFPPVIPFSSSVSQVGDQVWGICASPAEDPRIVAMEVKATGVNQTYGETDSLYEVANGLWLMGEAHPGCSGGPILDSTGGVIGMMVGAGDGGTLASSWEGIKPWVDVNVGDSR